MQLVWRATLARLFQQPSGWTNEMAGKRSRLKFPDAASTRGSVGKVRISRGCSKHPMIDLQRRPPGTARPRLCMRKRNSLEPIL
jgi:hypothetical protein